MINIVINYFAFLVFFLLTCNQYHEFKLNGELAIKPTGKFQFLSSSNFNFNQEKIKVNIAKISMRLPIVT